MGLSYTKQNTVGTFLSAPFIIDRIIGPDIMVGVNKYGESIKIKDKYYKLIDVHRIGSRLEFTFESNNNLTFEKLNEKSQLGANKLFYKLFANGNMYTGEMILPFKSISLNSKNLDMISEFQNEDDKN